MELEEYFQSCKHNFWQWEEHGDVIGIPNSSTIAYKAFVVDVLEKLAPQGIPPFGALLLVIIATNPNAENDLNTVYALINKKVAERRTTSLYIERAIPFLKMLAQIPQKYKAGKNRLLLLQTLFVNCHNIVSVSNSRKILQFYREEQDKSKTFFLEKDANYDYDRDFKVISLLANRFLTFQSLIESLTNLPQIEVAIAIEDPNVTEAGLKDFVQELTQNPKTFYIGSLIKRLWSGLNIPFHNVLAGQQPIGGVSDLTNKGDFDRLLISEFASDDLMFLSRLANNEALYINREIPPEHNNLERIILIDVSIKNWGTPRTIAYALMLAIAKHPKTNIHCAAFAVGNSYYPLAFNSIDDIIESMQLLDGCLHPATGLERFFREYPHQKNSEIFFISSTKILRHPVMHKVLSDHHSLFRYWIYTDSEGNIDLYKRQHNSKKHVQRIQLPLEELWKKEASSKKDIINNETAIKYPILFPGALNPKKILITSDDQVYQITAERQLLRLYQKMEKLHENGWQMLYENLPIISGEFEMGLMESGDYVLLIFNTQNREVMLLNINSGEKKSVFFTQWQSSAYKQFLFYKNHFYFISRTETFAISYYPEVKIIKCKDDIRQQLIEIYNYKEEETKNLLRKISFSPGVLKNITSVFINELNNLVFNKHELRLNEYSVIKLEKTGFLKRFYEATVTGKNEFTFTGGNTITVNRAGMLVFRNGALDNEPTFYVPSVLDVSLGIASTNDFSGNTYYLPSDQSGKGVMSTQNFWRQYITPFIENVKRNGT
jgi:hypothetical protein